MAKAIKSGDSQDITYYVINVVLDTTAVACGAKVLAPAVGKTIQQVTQGIKAPNGSGVGNKGGSGAVRSVDGLSDAAKSKITTSQLATLTRQERLSSHLTESDLLGAEKELNGIPLTKPDGTPALRPDGSPWNHVREVSDAYRGLEKLQKSYEGFLKNPNLDAELRNLYTNKLNDINNLMDRIDTIFDPSGGILPPQ